MNGFENEVYRIAYFISNAFAVLLLFFSWKWPRVARLLFVLLFAWASWINWHTALHSPDDYLNYANLTFFTFYKQFILGWFSKHIVVSIGFIATVQGIIALSLLMKGLGYKLGVIAAIIFLVAIFPFGVGSAFPCTIIMAVALGRLYHQHNYLWFRENGKNVALPSG